MNLQSFIIDTVMFHLSPPTIKTLLPSFQEHGGHWTVFFISSFGNWLSPNRPAQVPFQCDSRVIQSLNPCWNIKVWPSWHNWGQSKKAIQTLSNGFGWDCPSEFIATWILPLFPSPFSLPFLRRGIPVLLNKYHTS